MASKSVPSAATKLAPVSSYREVHQSDVINRLRRIEGQVRGLVDMIQSGRSCEDVALQMSTRPRTCPSIRRKRLITSLWCTSR